MSRSENIAKYRKRQREITTKFLNGIFSSSEKNYALYLNAVAFNSVEIQTNFSGIYGIDY